jgi:hypothetical protein
VNVVAGDNIKQLDVSKLSSGIYFVKIQTGEKVEIARIIIAK